jgi:hypothetical protein
MGEQFNKALIRDGTRKLAVEMTEYVAYLIRLKVTKAHLVEVDQNRHDFAHRKLACALSCTLAVRTQLLLPMWQKGVAKGIDMTKQFQ